MPRARLPSGRRACRLPPVRPLLYRLLIAVCVPVLVGLGCRERPAAPDAWPENPADLAATYVGDAACASCHEDLYAAFQRSGMGQSVSLFDRASAPEQFDAQGRSPVVYNEAFDLYYQAFVRADTLFQREYRLGPDGSVVHDLTYAVSHVVGSGNATRSYFMETPDGEGGVYLTEMPLTWYVERKLWDMSPGYDRSNSRFSRPINLECFTCHNDFGRHAPYTQNHFATVPHGIACERCHGPGSLHVDAHLSGALPDDMDRDPSIVNSAHLPVDLQLAVCQQCHLTGIKIFKPGASPETYRPGTPLSAHQVVFASENRINNPEAFGISSHALRMMQSACFTESTGTSRPMTCTTCHDPHRASREFDRAAFNATCASCHGSDAHEAACSRPGAGLEDAMRGDCVSCHMQQAGTSDIPHVTFTDHWIRRTLPAPAAGTYERARAQRLERRGPDRLVNVTVREGGAGTTGPEAELEEALAYFDYYTFEHTIPAYLPGVIAGVRRGLGAGVERPDAYLALGRAQRALDSLAAAERTFAAGAARFPTDAWLAYWLGATRLQQGRASEALAALQQADHLQPRLVEAHLKLGEALDAAGRLDEAAAAFREGVRRDPNNHPNGWNNLGFVLLRQNRLDDARPALERAVRLDPDLTVARLNLGSLYLLQNDLAAARRQLEAVLRIEPRNVGALGNLGVVAARQGRTADARRYFEQLLALDPADPRARAYLAALQRGERI